MKDDRQAGQNAVESFVIRCSMHMTRTSSNTDSEMKVKGKERNSGRINIFMLTSTIIIGLRSSINCVKVACQQVKMVQIPGA